MTILINSETKMLVQGLGRDGSFQASKCKSYGTPIVSAVHPGRGGSYFEDSIPIFETVEDAIVVLINNTKPNKYLFLII